MDLVDTLPPSRGQGGSNDTHQTKVRRKLQASRGQNYFCTPLVSMSIHFRGLCHGSPFSSLSKDGSTVRVSGDWLSATRKVGDTGMGRLIS